MQQWIGQGNIQANTTAWSVLNVNYLNFRKNSCLVILKKKKLGSI